MRSRGFEIISEYKDKGINLPVRKTKCSAGYDMEAAEDIVIPVYEYGMKPTLIPTGIKAYCCEDEYIIQRSLPGRAFFKKRVLRWGTSSKNLSEVRRGLHKGIQRKDQTGLNETCELYCPIRLSPDAR